ncbi:MAG: hypothetical protein HZB53_21615 [Chloroflexi bacterium]|nr:hypothetical protein [Chloroflexota bacterium]
MNKRKLRFILVFIAALALTPLLPLYVERTMLRSWRTDQVGDTVDWGWAIVTLGGYWQDYTYLRPEQQPALWLAVNLALAVAYALLIAMVSDFIVARRAR